MGLSPRIAEQFKANRHLAASRRVVGGFYWSVDRIVVPVALRNGTGKNFTPIATMSEFAQRVLAGSIREKLELSTVVVHPRKSAACATTEGTFWLPGPYCKSPLVTTGAGDHFNAGFTLGQLLGLTPQACLATGVGTSGFYVRSGRSPTLDELGAFLAE